MNIEKEIEEHEKQIQILREKLKQEIKTFEEDVRFTSGHIWMSKYCSNYLIKIFHINRTNPTYGYIYDDGSGRIFKTKIELYRVLDNDFIYVGVDKNSDYLKKRE